MKIDAYKNGNSEDVLNLAEEFHIKLPEDYRNFLIQHNGGLFSESDLIDLLDIVATLRGKFMLMMFPNEHIREYAELHSWVVHKVERMVFVSRDKQRQRVQEEWMVCNY